jgi:uncharacterized protein involved in response to NO
MALTAGLASVLAFGVFLLIYGPLLVAPNERLEKAGRMR